jgi:hypothetical protein
MFHEHTLWVLQLLYQCFDFIYITKPLTSRPANSEKYLVCCGYHSNIGLKKIEFLKQHIEVHDTVSTEESCELGTKKQHIDILLLYNIVMYNAYYTSRQVYYIQKTIDYICEYEPLKQNERYLKQDVVIARNKEKCKKWCIKYNIQSII